MDDQSYNHRAAMKTYFPNGYQMSLAMRRARRRYFWPNVKGWFITSLFAGAVYMYSIEAVRQDDFEDLLPLIPSLQERAEIPTIEDLEEARLERKRARRSSSSSASTSPSSYTDAARPSSLPPRADWGSFGVGPRLSFYWPRGDGLVRGAPSLLENGGGKIGDRGFSDSWAGGGRV